MHLTSTEFDASVRPPKPAPMPVIAENIPRELRERPQWVCWRWTWNRKKKNGAGKWDKPPLQCNGAPASSTNRSTWATFDDALAAYRSERLRFDGVGFVLTDGFVGVDLDDCRDSSTGEIDPEKMFLIERLHSYSEVSPSRKGVKILFLGVKPDGKSVDHERGIEVYGAGRYFTLTGTRLENSPATVEDRTSEISELVVELFPSETKGKGANRPRGEYPPPTTEAIRSALDALPPRFADDTETWSGIGKALRRHDPSEAMLTVWDDWSRRSNKYVAGECAKRWSRVDGDSTGAGRPMTIASIFYHARQAGWLPESIRVIARDGDVCAVDCLDRAQGRTERANAKRLIAAYGKDLRWCEDWNCWLVWDGLRWARDRERQVDSKMKAVVDSLWREIADIAGERPESTVRDMARFASASGGANQIRNAANLARSEPGIAVVPEIFDRQEMLLNVENGTIDLATGEIRSAVREDYITKVAPVKFDPAADCPLWRGFVHRITGGNQSISDYLQRAAGYSMTGRIREHALFFAYGRGANGKSTFLNRIADVLGQDYAITVPSELFLTRKYEGHSTERTDLVGKRFVATIEADDGKELAESFVKSVTGGDAIRARRMRENSQEFKPVCKLWIAANHRPVVKGDDDGIWRRVRLIPFTVSIPLAEQDANLTEKLRGELPGILNWMIQGCLEWQRIGLADPTEVVEATADYRTASDVLGQFLDERCEFDAFAVVAFSELYSRYRDWCESVEREPITETAFAVRLTDRNIPSGRGAGGKAVRKGLRLRPR